MKFYAAKSKAESPDRLNVRERLRNARLQIKREILTRDAEDITVLDIPIEDI